MPASPRHSTERSVVTKRIASILLPQLNDTPSDVHSHCKDSPRIIPLILLFLDSAVFAWVAYRCCATGHRSCTSPTSPWWSCTCSCHQAAWCWRVAQAVVASRTRWHEQWRPAAMCTRLNSTLSVQVRWVNAAVAREAVHAVHAMDFHGLGMSAAGSCMMAFAPVASAHNMVPCVPNCMQIMPLLHPPSYYC